MDSEKFQEILDNIVEATQILVKGRAISRSHHGNISMRIPNTSKMVLSTRSIINEDFNLDSLSLVDTESKESRDQLHPSSRSIVDMHNTIYEVMDNVSSVIHTHAPFTTSFAIAFQRIPCVYEAMVRHITEPIPVAKYAPRGSNDAIKNIQNVINANTRAVLLQNHGVLVFGPDAISTARLAVTIEEAAEMTILARSLGRETIIQNMY